MYKPKNLKINFVSRTIVGIVELVFSLLAFPYVARILGPAPVGQIDYITAAVSYFVILSTFGIDSYGGREVAQNRTLAQKVNEILARLLGLRFLLGIILFILYIFFAFPFLGSNKSLFYASSLMIITTSFNLVWVLEVLEDFTYLAISRFLSKILFISFLYLFVKTPNDAVKYFVGVIACDFLYYLFSVLRLSKTYNLSFNFKKMTYLLPKAEFFNLAQIFIIILVQSLITGIPSIIMGKLQHFHELGLLSTAQRIFWIGYYAIIPLSTVLQSRSMSFSNENKSNDFTKHLDKTANALMVFSVPITLGLILISADIIPLLVGTQYLDSILLLKIQAPMILLYSLNNFWSMQVVFTHKLDRALLFVNVIGLLCMLVLSIILIPMFQAKGAILSNLITTSILCVLSYLLGRRYYSMMPIIPDVIKVLVAGLIMYILLIGFHAQSYLMLGIKIIFGASIYFMTLYMIRHSLLRSLIKNYLKRYSSK